MPSRFLPIPHQPQRLESDCLAACDTHGDLELAWIAYDSYYAVVQLV